MCKRIMRECGLITHASSFLRLKLKRYIVNCLKVFTKPPSKCNTFTLAKWFTHILNTNVRNKKQS